MTDGHGVENLLIKSGKIRQVKSDFFGRSENKVWSELCFVKLLIFNDLLKLNSLLRGMRTWLKASCVFLNN